MTDTATAQPRTGSTRVTVWLLLGLLGVVVVVAAVQSVQAWGPGPLITALVALAAIGWVWLAWRGRKDNRQRASAFARARQPIAKPRPAGGRGGAKPKAKPAGNRSGAGGRAKRTATPKRRPGGSGKRPAGGGAGASRRPKPTTASRGGAASKRPGGSRSGTSRRGGASRSGGASRPKSGKSGTSRRAAASRGGASRGMAARSGGTSPRRARSGARGRIPTKSKASRRAGTHPLSGKQPSVNRRPGAGTRGRNVNPRARSRASKRAKGLAAWANRGSYGTRAAKYAGIGVAVPPLLAAAGIWRGSWATGRWARRKLDARPGADTLARKAWTSLWLACADAKTTVFPAKAPTAKTGRPTPGLPKPKPKVAAPVAPATPTTTQPKPQVAQPVRPQPPRRFTMHPALSQLADGAASLAIYRPEGAGADGAIPVLEGAEFAEALADVLSELHTQLAGIETHYREHFPPGGFIDDLAEAVIPVGLAATNARQAWFTVETEEENALTRVRNQQVNETGRDVGAHDQ